MGGKVGRACCAISGRESEDINHVVSSPTAPKDGRKEETLEWLNDLVAQLWPNINEAAQKIVKEQVTPQIQASLPGPLKGTHFKTFTLGTRTPKFGPIELVKRKNGLKLNLGLDYESDVDIEISAVVASIGIKSIRMRGQLVLRMEPLIHESPVVGGVTAYFNDPPELDLDFTGIGNVADAPGIAGLIRSQINSVISNAMVLPNVIAVPLATPAQGVQLADLEKPMPLAVLRVTPVKGTDLAAKDWNVMSKASSDPYVRVCLANDSWNSSVKKATLNPVWGDEDTHDFMVFDRDQHLWVDVYDEDYLSGSDFIGKPKWPLKAADAPRYSGKPLPLMNPKSPGDACGTVEMKFEWLQLSGWDPKAAAKGCVVKVGLGQMSFPSSFGKSAAVSAKLGSQEKISKLKTVTEPSPDKVSVATALAKVARQCKAKGLEEQAIMEITGLSKEDLDSALAVSDTKDAAAADVVRPEIDMDLAFYFSVDASDVNNMELTITALDAKLKPYATFTSSVKDVSAAVGERKARTLKPNEGEGSVQTDLEVCLFAIS